MAIMPPALISLGHLKTLVARVRHAGGAVSEFLLIWLAGQELFASIQALFTAWKSGELPPMPAPPAPVQAARAPRPQTAPRPHSVRRPARTQRTAAALPRLLQPATLPAAHPPAPTRPAPRVPPRAFPKALSQIFDIPAASTKHALFVTF